MTFVRPEWLWLFILLIPFTGYWIRSNKFKSNWHQIIEPDLLEAIAGQQIKKERHFNLLLPCLLACAILAMAGPAINNGEVKTSNLGNLVVVLDNSLSMAATDVTPDRITRAKRMILDWTQSSLFHQYAVIVYSGSAHWLTPFTQDAKTLNVQLSPVTPFIMPALGNRPDLAFEALAKRLNQLPNQPLSILWLTDDIQSHQLDDIASQLPETANKYLAVLGTEQGSAIPLPNDSGYLTDGDNMVIVQVDHANLYELGATLGFLPLSVGQSPELELSSELSQESSRLNNHQEVGYWLLIPIIIMFAFLLRTQPNLLASLSLITLFIAPTSVDALEISSLFLNRDQTALKHFEQKQYDQAWATANSAEIKGHAAFELGNYAEAASAFKTMNTASGFYNLGNSLAHQGLLEEALTAYEQALALENHASAKKNKRAIEQYLAQQQSGPNQNEPSSDGGSSRDQQATPNDTQDAQAAQNNPGEASEDAEPNQADANTEPQQSNEPSPQQGNLADDLENESTQQENRAVQSAEELREQQQIDAILNQLEAAPGYVTQQKFKYQHQQNPTSDKGTLW